MLFAGPVAEGLSWQWVFALPTVVVIATTLVVGRLMPHDPPVPSDGRRDRLARCRSAERHVAGVHVGLVTAERDCHLLPPLAVGAVVAVVAALATGWGAVERRAASLLIDRSAHAGRARDVAFVCARLRHPSRNCSRYRPTGRASEPAPPTADCSCCPVPASGRMLALRGGDQRLVMHIPADEARRPRSTGSAVRCERLTCGPLGGIRQPVHPLAPAELCIILTVVRNEPYIPPRLRSVH